MSSEDVNSREIVKQMAHPNSEKRNCDRSGDDVSTICASDQDQEISTTYSIAAELVDAINEKEGNSLLVFFDNQTDEGSAGPENETKQNMDHDISNDLNIDNVKNIRDQTDASAKNSENGNISDNAESNQLEHENRISEQNIESDDNMHQFANSDLRAATSNENGMDSDENAADDHNVKDNEEHASSTQ